MGEQIDRLFDTVNKNSGAFLDAMRYGNERVCRFSRMVIEEAALTQREQSDLTKQWMESPVDALGLTKSAMETWTQRQRRRLDLSRTFVDDIAGARDEMRDVVGRVAGANRDAAATGIETGRGVVAQARREVTERVEELSKAVDGTPSGRKRNGRK